MTKTSVSTESAPKALGPYSQAIRSGDTVYLSGQIPLDPATMGVVEGGIEAQTRRVFDNLQAVAKAAGGDLGHVVKLTLYLADLGEFGTVNQIMTEYFDEPYPAPCDGRGRAAPGRPDRDRRGDGAVLTRPGTASRTATEESLSLSERMPAANPLPVTHLPGVGPRLSERLAKLGIRHTEDLMFHLPSRYQDRTRLVPLGSLRAGQEALVRGRIELSSVAFGRRRALLTRVSDGTGSLTMRQFHFSRRQQEGLRQGHWIQCYGEVRRGPAGLEMIHPEYSVSAQAPVAAGEPTLTPIYPTTEGVSQRLLRDLIGRAMETGREAVVDWLPRELTAALGMPSLAEALDTVHGPTAGDLAELEAGRHPAQQRLAFEELLGHHLALRRLRQRRRRLAAPVMQGNGSQWRALRAGLGFELTAAQARVIDEVLADLASATPALRLVQGDVGAGKTVVAAAAALRAVEAGYQVALMAPTELLAEQHLGTFRQWLEPLGIEVGWLSGRLSPARRRDAIDRIAGGVPVSVGTHALYQEGVDFPRLGLIIVDEQHRFGVDQRLALRAKGASDASVPHQLTMTATPIPRSLAMVFYADLDVSSIDELPPGRTPVETVVVSNARREEVQQRVRAACDAGRQAYWVCPIIEESEALQAQAATDTEAALTAAFPDLAVGLIHGRMKPADKDKVMRRFRDGELQLLVATTVIEVGVDVPAASLMVIENAERLGLSQLHQLRGRVGRGAERAACVLMYQPPLGAPARDRLAIMRRTNDGFEIAAKDLEQRGPGEVLGTRQTGMQRLHVADLARDRGLLPKIERAGRAILAGYPDRVEPLVSRWVREAGDYASV